jgi:hypothetical protein
MNWIFKYYLERNDRLCDLVVRVPGYRSRGPGLERRPLSLVNAIEELLGRESSGSGLENRECGRTDPLRWPRNTLYPQINWHSSPTGGGRSVGILRSRTKATEYGSQVTGHRLLMTYEMAAQSVKRKVVGRGSISGRGSRLFPTSQRVQTGSGAHPAPTQWISTVLWLGANRPGCEADQPSPKNEALFLCFWYSFLLGTEWTWGPSAAGRIR